MKNENLYILGDIANFLLVGILFVIVLAITFKITLKNYNVKLGDVLNLSYVVYGG